MNKLSVAWLHSGGLDCVALPAVPRFDLAEWQCGPCGGRGNMCRSLLVLSIILAVVQSAAAKEPEQASRKTALLDLGPLSIDTRNYAYTLVNLVMEWFAYLLHQVIVQLIF